jgi:hypothetical protein
MLGDGMVWVWDVLAGVRCGEALREYTAPTEQEVGVLGPAAAAIFPSVGR